MTTVLSKKGSRLAFEQGASRCCGGLAKLAASGAIGSAASTQAPNASAAIAIPLIVDPRYLSAANAHDYETTT